MYSFIYAHQKESVQCFVLIHSNMQIRQQIIKAMLICICMYGKCIVYYIDHLTLVNTTKDIKKTTMFTSGFEIDQ